MHGDPRLPNLFVVGAPKAGTTSMHAALAGVPQIFMSKVKEPGFFSSDRQFARGIDYYLDAHFGQAAGYRFRGDATPWYLYSEKARLRISQLVGGGSAVPYIVVLLRRPADRAYSMYLDQQRVGNEDRRFEDAVEQEIQQIESGDLPDDIRRRYVWCGRYATHVNNWKKAFGDDHMRAFLTDDLRWPVKVWSDLSGFLCYDLGEERLAQLSIRERNVAGELRWPHVVRALRRLEGRDSKVIRRIQRWLPPGWDRRVAQGIFNRNQVTKARPVPIPPDFTMRLLDKYYLPDVAELEEILNRPLTAWRPENIGRR